MREQFQTAEDITVGTSLTTILEETNLSGLPIVNIEIENTGANAFTDFAVQLKDHSLGEWYTLSSSTDWASTGVPWHLRVMDPDPKTLGAGLLSHVLMYVGVPFGIRVQAKRTSATTAQVRMSMGGS